MCNSVAEMYTNKLRRLLKSERGNGKLYHESLGGSVATEGSSERVDPRFVCTLSICAEVERYLRLMSAKGRTHDCHRRKRTSGEERHCWSRSGVS